MMDMRSVVKLVQLWSFQADEKFHQRQNHMRTLHVLMQHQKFIRMPGHTCVLFVFYNFTA